MARVVLIVDDSPQSATNLEIALGGLPGIEVAVAATGRDALALLGDPGRPVAAMLTDLEMPRMDGFELIERVRSDSRWRQLPIIVISGATDPGASDRALRLGANAYFTKPYSPGEVRNQLERLLNENPT